MPMENEHSARLINPPKIYIRVRRTDGSGDGNVQGVKIPASIAVIWFIVKKEGKEVPIAQALRFPTRNWTAEKAKNWLKDNKIKYIRFEPAKEKEKQSMSDKAPLNACIFNESSEVSFDEQESNRFSIVGYSGEIIKDHWYWGNFGSDLKGMKFAKIKIPVLESHFTTSRIGYTTKQEISDKVIVKGEFLENDNAQALKKDMLKGFPMEASVLLFPLVVEIIKEGMSVEVNGHTLKGPGTIFRQSVIREVSMCVFGADSNTRSEAYADNENKNVKFNLFKETEIMPVETEIKSIENFAEQYPEIYGELFEKGKTDGLAEGRKAERDLFLSLQKTCGDDNEILVKCFGENKTVEEALQMRAGKLQAEKKLLDEEKAKLQKKKVDPANTEFNDNAEFNSASEVDETKATDKQLKEKFEQDQKLQDEFGDLASYLAYIKHEIRK